MVAVKSLLALVACLQTSKVLANPVGNSTTIVGGGNTDIGLPPPPPHQFIKYSAFAEKRCSGTDQGETWAFAGQASCANVSNMKSFRIVGAGCNAAYLEYFKQTDCRGENQGTFTHGIGCIDKAGTYGSVRIHPRGC